MPVDRTIKASLGTLVALGLRDVKLDAFPTTLYLMVSEKCMYSCAYCPQSKASLGSSYEKLSRVPWPEVDWEILKKAIIQKPDFVKRMCFQVVNGKNYFENLLYFMQSLKEAFPDNSNLPISVSIRPKDLSEVETIFQAGAERVGIPIDSVSESLFPKIRGGSFKAYLDLILESARKFKGHVTTHLIVGLGESDREIFNAMKLFYDNSITVALFSFTPVSGTPLAQSKPPALARYRRIQLMRFLFQAGYANSLSFNFADDGTLVSIFTDLSTDEIYRLISSPGIFMTSGCHNCNRPYYNETPTGPMYNYPFVPNDTQKLIDVFIEKIENERIYFRK
jgi:biotin synthase